MVQYNISPLMFYSRKFLVIDLLQYDPPYGHTIAGTETEPGSYIRKKPYIIQEM